MGDAAIMGGKQIVKSVWRCIRMLYAYPLFDAKPASEKCPVDKLAFRYCPFFERRVQ